MELRAIFLLAKIEKGHRKNCEITWLVHISNDYYNNILTLFLFKLNKNNWKIETLLDRSPVKSLIIIYPSKTRNQPSR